MREPAVLEFYSTNSDETDFDFRTPDALRQDLKTILWVENSGKRAVDAIAFEIIGMVGLTLQFSDPEAKFSSLPAFATRLDLYSTLPPDTHASIDMRRYILMYLAKLVPQLSDRTSVYRTVINVVMSPKAVSEATPSPAGSGSKGNDRVLISVQFLPSIIDTPEAKALLEKSDVVHRIYGN